MKKMIIGIIMALVAFPIFATGEFNLDSPNGQCLINSSYVVEDKCFQAEQYMLANYPELSIDDRQSVIAAMSDWNTFESLENFYEVIDIFVILLKNE